MTLIPFETLKARIFQIDMRALPNLQAYAYIVVNNDFVTMIDTGSGSDESNADLEAGMTQLYVETGITWDDIQRIIITHGHIDHYGGLGFVRSHSNAPIAAHTLDAPTIRDPQATTNATIAATTAFLLRAGISEPAIKQFKAIYQTSPLRPTGWNVDMVVTDGDLIDQRFRVIHTPGHCAGQICLMLNDVLFSADHIMSHTNPRLTPAHLEPHNGLDAYLNALDRVAAIPGLRLGLAGHEAPINDLYLRIEEIRAAHIGRLGQILALCAAPHSIAEICASIYPDMNNPHMVVLMVQAIATRVEYLEQQGQLERQIDPAGVIERFLTR